MRQPTSSGRFSKMPPQLAVRLHYFRRHEGRERKTDSKPNGPSLIGPFEALYPGWIAVSGECGCGCGAVGRLAITTQKSQHVRYFVTAVMVRDEY